MSVAFLVEDQDSGSDTEESDVETLALIMKNFSKILKEIN